MLGLSVLMVLGCLLALAVWAFVWTYRTKRRAGKSDGVAFVWAIGAVLVLSLPITWDAIPTWIAFKYYAKKEAGITVFKTLEQWKVENPGVAETLQPYRFGEKRAESKSLGNNKFRALLNDRFAYDSISKEKLFLSVHANRHEVIDLKNEEVLVRYVEVASGNAGGLASGGEGWWAPWLIHRAASGFNTFFQILESIRNLRGTK